MGERRRANGGGREGGSRLDPGATAPALSHDARSRRARLRRSRASASAEGAARSKTYGQKHGLPFLGELIAHLFSPIDAPAISCMVCWMNSLNGQLLPGQTLLLEERGDDRPRVLLADLLRAVLVHVVAQRDHLFVSKELIHGARSPTRRADNRHREGPERAPATVERPTRTRYSPIGAGHRGETQQLRAGVK